MCALLAKLSEVMWLVPPTNKVGLHKVFYITVNKLMYGNIFKKNSSVNEFS